jgi:hypothetical protein
MEIWSRDRVNRLTIRNLTNARLSVDARLNERKSVRELLGPGASSRDLSGETFFDELVASPEIHRLRRLGKIVVLEQTGQSSAGSEFRSVITTQPGASPYAVTFAALGIEDMADDNYSVFVGGETAAEPQESSYTTTGFALLGGNIGDVIHLLITGTIAS